MNIGDRVIAIRDACVKKVFIYGYGIYKGDLVPEYEGKRNTMADTLKELGVKNPTIELDNGKIVYGCECWWGGIGAAEKEFIRGREIVVVDINEISEEEKKRE